MPGPFPGMDPYLESRRFWRGFHNMLIGEITGLLNRDLPPGFAANYEERVYVIPNEGTLLPDVAILRQVRPSAGRAVGGGTVVMEPGAPDGILITFPEEVREGYVAIRSVDNFDTVITIIELLSPTNKAPNSIGRQEYVQKQQEILNSDTNLLEIDLLRGGAHTVAAPLEGLRARGSWDCLICLHRVTNRHQVEFWLNSFRDPLPLVRVPLTPELPDTLLDLQAAFNQTYDSGPYRRMVDYTQEPPNPLQGEDVVWMDTLLREKGLRP